MGSLTDGFQGMVRVFGLGLVAVILVYFVCDSVTTYKNETNLPRFESAADPSQEAMSTQYSSFDVQRKLSEIVDRYAKQYKKAPNDLKASQLRINRRQEIENLFGTNPLKIHGWRGKLSSMDTTDYGDAHIEIELEDSDIRIGSWEIILLGKNKGKLIPMGSALFKVIADMEEGDRVEFCGVLEKGMDDYLYTDDSESGAMKAPNFICKITDIKAL